MTQQQCPFQRMFNLAHRITLARIFIVPAIVVLLMFPGRITCLAAVVLFASAYSAGVAQGLVQTRGWVSRGSGCRPACVFGECALPKSRRLRAPFHVEIQKRHRRPTMAGRRCWFVGA